MKRVRTSLFFVAVLGVLALWGSAWGVESSESIQGLISHWGFDEGSGTTAYDSAGNNDGTVYGAQWTTGQIDGALNFDGVDDYVDVGDKASLDFGADDSFSISAWIKTNEDHSTIVYKRRCAGPGGVYYEGYDFRLREKKLFLNIEDTSNNSEVIYANTIVADDQWHHVVAVRDTTEDKLYLYADGSTDATPVTDPTTATLATSRSFHIGHRDSTASPDPYVYYDGTMDDVRIYDRALSPEEIWQIYQGELANLVGLEIIGPNEVPENSTASYKAIAHYDDNSTNDVTSSALWAVEPNMAANIDENGVLTTKDIVKDRSATILASYTEGNVTFEAEKAIDILAICPIGTALEFDGVDDYVDCGSDISLDLGSGSFTLAAWIKTSVRNQLYDRIVSHYCGWELGHRETVFLDFDGNHHAQVWIRDNGLNEAKVTGTTNIEDGKWHYVVGVRDGNTLYLYVDGTLEGIPADAGAVGDVVVGPAPWTIGAAKDYRGILYTHYNGLIDEVAIYNRALSAEEIWANMHRRLTGDELGLVGYWDFDEGEGQIVYDLSGNGNDGQLGSTPNPDVSDPAWVDSDAPVGICSLYQIATLATDGAVERKTAMLEELLAALTEEWMAYEALEEWLEGGDYGDLNKGNIVTAKQKIHSATQHEEQSIGALEKNVEKLEDALSALGYEPDMAANIDENGVLTTKDFVKHQSATILASYTERDVTVEAEKTIDILAICPMGTALKFDGVDDYVEINDDSSLEPQNITVAAWVYRNGVTTRDTILQKGTTAVVDGRNGYLFRIAKFSDGVPNKVQFYIVVENNTNIVSPPSTTTIVPNQWYHIAATYDSSNIRMYVNGVEEGTPTGETRPIDYTGGQQQFKIGVAEAGHGSPQDFFNGTIDEVAIYNRALSAEEIQTNMHRRLTGDEPGLVGYWDFDEGEGQIVYDLSGNGNDGQLGPTPEADSSDPAWVGSDAPIGICSLYQIATMATEHAVERKTALLEELLAVLAEEWTAYEALEELLESGDYGDLNKGDIVTAKQKIHSATQHEEQAIDALEKSIEKLEDALSALGYEPEPPPPPPGQASNPNPADGATGVSPYANLSWTAGPNAVSHDVYFGTTSPGTFRGNQTATTFDPGTMATYTTYYWRIDEVNPGGTTTGTVWSFITTGGGPGPR